MWIACEGREVENIIQKDEACDYEGLGNLNAIDAGEDIDRVGREYGKGSHVSVVHPSCIWSAS